jgi:predicted amino acid-binding ACT domain protein
MQILGDLLNLPANEEQGLPLPWWHRAPLGLTNNTVVYAALTVPTEGRPVPDLIVTVLNPSQWDQMFRLDCFQPDRPGIVAEVVKTIYPLNIALAETVKLERDGLHHVRLICEPVPVFNEQETQKHLARIKETLTDKDFEVKTEPLPPLPELTEIFAGQVEHGWLTGINWKAAIMEEYPDTVGSADLGKVVVSADTASRVLRFVFPRKGAMTIAIKHADTPGALAEITEAFRRCNLNILSAFTRRGGGRGVDAELVAVCEPEHELDAEKSTKLKEEIKENILRIKKDFRPHITINEGKNADERIYCRHPDEIVARVPRNLYSRVQEMKNQYAGKLPIFVSHRFIEDRHAEGVFSNVRQALEDNDCIAVEAPPTVAQEQALTYTEVSSRMWVAKAGIVLITDVSDNRPITPNLAHEFGYLLGQGKSMLMLVENKHEVVDAKEKSFSNLSGIVYAPFDPMVAPKDPQSVYSQIKQWVENNVLKSL